MRAFRRRAVLSAAPRSLAWSRRAAALASLVALAAGCAQEEVTVSTRSLERSGRASFVCLAAPGTLPRVSLPLSECDATQVKEITQYAVDVTGSIPRTLPHLYALVTQTTRGEVAVIDLTSQNGSVLDQDPGVPGANFLPIGAQPADIVSTPGGTATFVGTAEVGRPAIFALPSSRIRPASAISVDAVTADGAGGAGGSGGDAVATDLSVPELSSWPGCALPSAPGQMLLLRDPDVNGLERRSCDGGYADAASDTTPHPNGDLRVEGQGRQKLVVAMPDLGGIAIFDAQSILDPTPAKSMQPCPIERWLPLDVAASPIAPSPPPQGVACVNAAPASAPLPATFTSRPAGISFADGRLYVGDLGTPVIHVLEVPTPCEPVETKPLRPTSAAEPQRAVFTRNVAVAPSLTPELQRYLYAVDALDGSTMVFDVTDDQAPRVPLQRRHPEWNPFDARDRIRFGAPAADLILVEHDVPEKSPVTGVAAEGTRCNPDQALEVCTPDSMSCDPQTLYRTSENFDSGAGPLKLRGTFGFLALTNGQVAVIDVDDFDAPCRVPAQYSPLFGCPPAGSDAPAEGPACSDALGNDGEPPTNPCLFSSHEASCNVVVPNTARSATYISPAVDAGQKMPGLQIYPLLYNKDGSLLPVSDAAAPKMVATTSATELFVAGQLQPIESTSGLIKDANDELHHAVGMNLEDPRAHIVDQGWSVTFEGALPGFADKSAQFVDRSRTEADLNDPNSRFCDAGVQSENMVREQLAAAGDSQESIDSTAACLADYVQIANELPEEDNTYWKSDLTSGVCTFQSCQSTFGAFDVPRTARDWEITEAYHDHVELLWRNRARWDAKCQLSAQEIEAAEDPDAPAPELADGFAKCCFPGVVRFNVRTGNQWAAVGDLSQFLNHVIADPATGVCRNSCDPAAARVNGRIRMAEGECNTAEPVPGMPPPITTGCTRDGDPRSFINPMFRFAIKPGDADPQRDYQFRFITTGAFTPLLISLATEEKQLILPVGMTFVSSTGELAVTDGSINGLIMVSLSAASASRAFF